MLLPASIPLAAVLTHWLGLGHSGIFLGRHNSDAIVHILIGILTVGWQKLLGRQLLLGDFLQLLFVDLLICRVVGLQSEVRRLLLRTRTEQFWLQQHAEVLDLARLLEQCQRRGRLTQLQQTVGIDLVVLLAEGALSLGQLLYGYQTCCSLLDAIEVTATGRDWGKATVVVAVIGSCGDTRGGNGDGVVCIPGQATSHLRHNATAYGAIWLRAQLQQLTAPAPIVGQLLLEDQRT